jgi:hypothetical protein
VQHKPIQEVVVKLTGEAPAAGRGFAIYKKYMNTGGPLRLYYPGSAAPAACAFPNVPLLFPIVASFLKAVTSEYSQGFGRRLSFFA